MSGEQSIANVFLADNSHSSLNFLSDREAPITVHKKMTNKSFIKD
jgi:hypothetical protein